MSNRFVWSSAAALFGIVMSALSGPAALLAQGSAGAGAGAALQWSDPPAMGIDPSREYRVVLSTTMGDLEITLFPEEAPLTVNNFVFLARAGYYDGVIFHRIIRSFMVQTGDPTGTGAGGPGYRFPDEPVGRGYSRGIVAMANAGPNTNGSQFFIVHGEQVALPPSYTIFGEVSGGLDILDRIAEVPVAASRGGEVSAPQVRVEILSAMVVER